MLPAILAGLMSVKGIMDSARQRREKLAQAGADAQAIRFSPWSGLNVSNLVGKDYTSQSPISGALAGGLSGATAGMNIDNAMADQDLAKQKADYYKSRIMPVTPAPAAAAMAAKNPYAGLNMQGPDYLKGQAVRNMPYGMGVGDV